MADENEKKISPMMQQYLDIKEQYGGYVLFFRLGDFYEMFFEDAVTVSRELELALTSRAGSPMCGVPFHSAELYIKKLIDRGFKVAICEQLQDPKLTKGLVERGVIRLVTAGTVTESAMLSEDSNNYIACVCAAKDGIGIALADISTGEAHVFEKKGKNREQETISELSRFAPVEILINNGFLDLKEVHEFVKTRLSGCAVEMSDDDCFDISDPTVITSQFDDSSDSSATLESLGIASLTLAQMSLSALFRYICTAQRVTVKRFVTLSVHAGAEYMELSLTARRNLELCETLRSKEKRGSLLWVIDKTGTAMGRRVLRAWIERPLTSHTQILSRLDAVDELVRNPSLLSDIRDELKGVYDLERLMSRIIYRSATPRDIYAFGQTFSKIPALKATLSDLKSKQLVELNSQLSELTEVSQLIGNAIVDEPPQTLKDGGVIKPGFNEEIDRLREITGGGRDILKQIEQREREATNIRTLKVGYNRVFGYYIEVSKSFIDQVPAHYIRKQTLTNGERYITEELKKVEGEILGANDRILGLEQAVFNEIRDYIATKLTEVQETAGAAARLDALCSFAQVSLEYGYVKPEITLDPVIDIRDGRHPVIEKMMQDHSFTPNDVLLDNYDNRLLIITGPNMSGKSTFMRQTALIVLMAQIGCFVPAKYAKIGVVDKIFTRVGASDDLTAGQSTFMVEMNEVAEILRNATKNSLVILDEIGRGTSTFDGISIARSVAEHIVKKIGCKTLFATHYHELITMESEMDGVRNFSVAVSRRGDDIKFLHRIIKGGTDDSYGIEVAKLAGLPQAVIKRAKEELKELEISGKMRLSEAIENNRSDQFNFAAVNEQNALARLRSLDINTISPLDALMLIKELKESLDG
ncbi:MAG: DNA mismatch repair protein MutS [Oscillospiraceae bacterium]|nr:DNA mismatch repair protein MutS [Oscillospiraceae bacterium]